MLKQTLYGQNQIFKETYNLKVKIPFKKWNNTLNALTNTKGAVNKAERVYYHQFDFKLKKMK